MINHISLLLSVFISSALTGWVIPFVVAAIIDRKSWRIYLVLLLALAIVGACAGVAGGMSRAPAVGEIIPAFLGLLGGVAIYLFGLDRSKGLMSSICASALALSLFLGYSIASQIRAIGEDHREIRAICAEAYANPLLLSNDSAFQEFRERMGGPCDMSMAWWISSGNSFWWNI